MSASAVWPVPSPTTMPMLAETTSRCSPTEKGAARASRTACAAAMASRSPSSSSQRIANSSPPSRASVSAGRSRVRSRCANASSRARLAGRRCSRRSRSGCAAAPVRHARADARGWAGDEFAILCEELDGERDAIAAAQAVLDALAAPFSVGEQRLVVSASIGIVVGDGTGHTADALIRDADVAMYRAKDQGGSRYELFDHAMRRRVVERLGLESDMRRALERGEFTLFFQPIVSTAERRIAGVEALVRWEHPELGVVPPSAFIPVAEESGLIVPLGRWVLNEACRRLARWLADPAIDVPYLSVNISGRHSPTPRCPTRSRASCDAPACPPTASRSRSPRASSSAAPPPPPPCSSASSSSASACCSTTSGPATRR
jgi:hypothetical protein